VSTDFDALAWLQGWFASKCDGEWEKQWGVSLTSTDDGGWFLSVPLMETELEGRAFDRVDHNKKGHDESWWICQIGESHFLAACGPRDLAAVIGLFRAWAEG
jgi:hypothetical protein